MLISAQHPSAVLWRERKRPILSAAAQLGGDVIEGDVTLLLYGVGEE